MTFLQDKFIIVLYDPSKLKLVKFNCRCSNAWVEEIPGEAHDAADIRILVMCPSCSQGYTLCNKAIERFGDKSVGKTWTQQAGGNA